MHPIMYYFLRSYFQGRHLRFIFPKTNLVVVVKPLGEPNHGNSTTTITPRAWPRHSLQVTGESQEIVTKVGDFEDQGAHRRLKTDQWHPMAIISQPTCTSFF